MIQTQDTLESVWAEHESIIRRFEEAWEAERPDLASAIPSGVREPGLLLAELVQIDLEFRFRAGERPRVEEYLSRYPDLSSDQTVLELIGSELSLRDKHGPVYSAAELNGRFPHLAVKLEPLLTTRVDRRHTRGGKRWNAAVKPTLPGYEVGDQLGRGGMGVVYRAEQANPVRTVAVKTLLDVPSDRTAARFRREAEAMARLDHPNIVPVYEVGEWSSGAVRLPYLTMKWYAGGCLDNVACGPGTPVGDHALMVETIARAVHHAHQRGVLHRDLKPSNILLDEAGQPAVGDFGLAGWFDPDSPARLSETVVGTPAYMAPEQVLDPAGVTTAADVYGLGAILYHLLTGNPPLDGASMLAFIGQLGTNTPSRPSGVNPAVPRDLETICLKCLEADPRSRYPSADALADDLARWRKGEAITARRAGIGERLWRAVRRHPVVTGLSVATAAAVLVTIITLAVSVRRVHDKEAETAAALDREKHALYLERVAAAGRLYQMSNLEQAWDTLGHCPGPLRDWEWNYLDQLRRNTPSPFRHIEAVVSVGVLADGRPVTADRGERVRVWSTSLPTLLSARGTAVRTHPTQNLIAVRDDKRVAVIDVDSDAVRFTVPFAGWFDFTPDGKLLAVADRSEVKLFAVGTWEPGGELTGHTDTIYSGVFTADSATLYTGSTDRTVVAWDLKERKVKTRWTRELPVLALGLSADETTLVECLPSQVTLTDVGTGGHRRLNESSSGRPTLLRTFDPTLYVSSTASGDVLLRPLDGGSPKRTYRGHIGVVYAAAVSRDGKWLLTGGEDGTARVWDLTTAPEYAEPVAIRHPPGGLTVSADGRRAAVGSRGVHTKGEEEVAVFDPITGQVAYRVSGSGGVAFDPRGRWLATARRDGTVVIRDAADGTERRTLDTGPHGPAHMLFRPDGGQLAVCVPRGGVRVWDTQTWQPVALAEDPDRKVTAMTWSPDAARLAACIESDVLVYDTVGGAVVRRITTEYSPVAVAFSPDGRSLAVAGRGRSLELYDPDTGHRRRACVGNPAVATAIAFSPAGTRLATAGADGFVRLWDVESGKEVLSLNGGSELSGVAWSPDGNHLFTAGTSFRRWTASD